MYKIMIVDDEKMSQDMIQKYITARLPEYQVSAVCGNGLEALHSFEETPADIVLVDIRMPVMDGLALIEKLNRLSQDYVPIIVSSYGEFEYAKTAMKLGVKHYLLKPLDFKELTHALEVASHTLKSNRLARASLSSRDDEQEAFFMDVLTGKYPYPKLVSRRFAELSFPFPYDRSAGIYFHLSFSQPENWGYGREGLHTAICNLITFTYTPRFIVPLFRKPDSCNYLMILEDRESLSFDSLCRQAEQILGISLAPHVLLPFASIEQLYSQQTKLTPAASPSPAFEDKLNPEENTAIQIGIEKAIEYMKEHYAEDLTRDDVAEKVFMSGAHFSRCFKMITNTTYKDYLTEIRMLKAIELLNTNTQIQDIALKVGYPNPNRFNINFRQYTSYTPSEYRTQILKQF